MKVKVGLIGLFDMLKFKNLGKNREEMILKSSNKELPYDYKVNELARVYHPYKQYLKIKDIKDENEDTKTFTLIPDEEKTLELAPFKAGSYISIYVKTNDNIVSRAYSLSSSPKEALNNIYKITIKKKPDGYLSNYLFNNAKVGDKLFATEPGGNLTYNKLRDSKNVIAIAGGVGITPFISMAKAINEGSENFNLTILYGIRTTKDIIFKNELDELTKNNSNIKIVYVFSDEKVEGYPFGFIGSELIKNYLSKDEPTSVFASGPEALLTYLDKELPLLKLEQKYIRIERSPISLDLESKEYNLTIHSENNTYEIKAKGNETLLEAFERNNLIIRAKCHLGGCGYCRTKLIKGTYVATKYLKLKDIDKEFNYIHPCCSYPTSDMELEIFPY